MIFFSCSTGILFLIAQSLLEDESHFISGIFKETFTSVKENIEFSKLKDSDTPLESLFAFLKLQSHNTYSSSSPRPQKKTFK